jgi:hypothetical protein
VATLALLTYGLYLAYDFYSDSPIDPYRYKIPERAWKEVSKPKNGLVIRVLQYNVLADAYTKGLSNIAHYPGKKSNVL